MASTMPTYTPYDYAKAYEAAEKHSGPQKRRHITRQKRIWMPRRRNWDNNTPESGATFIPMRE